MIGLARRIARDMNSDFRHRIIYLASGALTAVIYYGFVVAGLFILYHRVPYVLVVVAAHLVTVVIVYPWYRLVVFPGSAVSWLAGYLRFYLAGLGFLAASAAGLPILVEFAGIPILIAQALIIVASVGLNYQVNKLWAFRDGERSGPGNRRHNLEPRREALEKI